MRPRPPGRRPFLLADGHMGHGIIGGIAYGGVLEIFHLEAGAGVIQAIHQQLSGANVRDANFQVGVQVAAPFNRVVQKLAEGVPNFFPSRQRANRFQDARENSARD